jgi:predicted amidohydrolase
MNVKLAVVQPRTRVGPGEEVNVKEATRYIDEAARQGALLDPAARCQRMEIPPSPRP